MKHVDASAQDANTRPVGTRRARRHAGPARRRRSGLVNLLVIAAIMLGGGLGCSAADAPVPVVPAAPATVAPPADPPGTPTVGTLRWSRCAQADAFECATLKVPLDHGSPAGPLIDVAAIRHPATDPARRIGSLFWNPGGPGGAGTDSLPLFWSLFPETLRARYDIVSFDPRGIGRSTPLQCFTSPQQEQRLLARLPTGFPVGRSEERRQISIQATFNAACAARGGAVQRHMSTANVARDMDRLRAAVGAARLDYWGTSYGTYLGVTYANLFPQRAGHIILDGNVPPVQWNDAAAGTTTNTFTRIQSPLGTQNGATLMLQQCGAAGPARCSFAAASPEETVEKYRSLLRRLRANPVTVAGTSFTYAAAVSQTASLLVAQNRNPVTQTGWTDLADVLQVLWLQSTSTSPVPVPPNVVDLLSGAHRPASAVLPEATPGVLCSESPNPRGARSYGAQAAAANEAQAPGGFGTLWAWYAQPCATWSARDTDRYDGPWDRATQPYLVIGTLADSNTAFVGSELMAAQLPNARLLVEEGGGHTALLNRSRCIDDHAVAYLISGALPGPGTSCAQDRNPF